MVSLFNDFLGDIILRRINRLMIEFGRCGSDLFTLDARFPLMPVQAFAIALSSFDAYDSA